MNTVKSGIKITWTNLPRRLDSYLDLSIFFFMPGFFHPKVSSLLNLSLDSVDNYYNIRDLHDYCKLYWLFLTRRVFNVNNTQLVILSSLKPQ